MSRFEGFWQRVTDGMELNQLWKQFQTEAQSSYRLYSRDVDTTQQPGTKKSHHYFQVVKQFFWAILEKLTPARRVLLLIALVLLFINIDWEWGRNGHTQVVFSGAFWAGLLLLALLILEIGDRVVMKRDLQIAKEIQAWLLPAKAPVIAGIEIAFTTRPANTVAGDYYDVFARQGESEAEQTYLMAVADVAGKSVPAAMLMATFQASLKTLAQMHGSVAELAQRMNTYACGNSQNGRRFTTTFLAEYAPATRTLTYVNAGHNPPMLRRGSGVIERLEKGGMPLGIVEDAVYEPGLVKLESGDWLVVFTDGVTEAEDHYKREYGEARLTMMVNALARTSPETMLQAVMRDLDMFVGDAPQHDDVTLLLMKVV